MAVPKPVCLCNTIDSLIFYFWIQFSSTIFDLRTFEIYRSSSAAQSTVQLILIIFHFFLGQEYSGILSFVCMHRIHWMSSTERSRFVWYSVERSDKNISANFVVAHFSLGFFNSIERDGEAKFFFVCDFDAFFCKRMHVICSIVAFNGRSRTMEYVILSFRIACTFAMFYISAIWYGSMFWISCGMRCIPFQVAAQTWHAALKKIAHRTKNISTHFFPFRATITTFAKFEAHTIFTTCRAARLLWVIEFSTSSGSTETYDEIFCQMNFNFFLCRSFANEQRTKLKKKKCIFLSLFSKFFYAQLENCKVAEE